MYGHVSIPSIKYGDSGCFQALLTISGRLPHGHHGALAVKLYFDYDMAGAYVFQNQAWILWSNSRLAQAAVQKQNQAPLVPGGSPIKVEHARKAFKFTGSSPKEFDPKYGEQVWSIT